MNIMMTKPKKARKSMALLPLVLSPWRSQRQGGFTFTETMIAMFFITFIVSEMAMISLHSSRTGMYARRLTTASMLAERNIETSRNATYNNLVSGTEYYDMHGSPTASATAPQTMFTLARTVTPQPAGTALNVSNYANLDVVVSWTDRGVTQQVSSSSILTRY